MKYKRALNIDLPTKQSAFLWGARKTGKSTFLKEHFSEGIFYDLLKSEIFLRYLQEPHRFREEILALPAAQKETTIIIDEIQKIPELLDEVHWLIENTDHAFVLCGSSPRKLKKLSNVNLLGGRAWKYHFFPLTYGEIGAENFDLLKALDHGTIPSHYDSSNIKKSLQAYVEDYLILEIQAEGIVRNLAPFARFLYAASFSNAECLNYNKVASDSSIDAKTVKEYYQILIDTLLGYYVFPYKKSPKRDIISQTPKFYFFDTGIANALSKKKLMALQGAEAGNSLETYVLHELMAYKYLNDLDFDIHYWRTKTGFEVDFVLGDARVALEVKISSRIRREDLKGLEAFTHEYTPDLSLVISTEAQPRKLLLENGKEILILPVEDFLNRLWAGEIWS